MTQVESKPPPGAAPVMPEQNTAAAPAPVEVALPAPLQPLPAERLYRAVSMPAPSFELTAEIEPADGLVGQQRALDAIEFGTRVDKPGFNLFVIGPNGMRAQRAVEQVLKEAAGERPNPSDWVYVNNFADPRKPVAIALPAGRAVQFRDAMRALIDDLKTALPAVFESEDYQTRRGAIDQAFQAKQGEAFSPLSRQGGREKHRDFAHPDGLCVSAGSGGPSGAAG